jgi:nicotinamidase-related amidase
MKKTAILVIDMLNDYLTPEGLVYCEKGKDIIPNISRCLTFSRQNGILVVYINTCLRLQDILVKKWGLHAVKGTVGAQVVRELAPLTEDLIVTKQYYNGFFMTELHTELQSRGITDIVITGIHTHVCVLLTAVGAFEHGYTVVTLEDCITTAYQPNHESRLRFFKSHVGELMDSQLWIEQIKKS